MIDGKNFLNQLVKITKEHLITFKKLPQVNEIQHNRFSTGLGLSQKLLKDDSKRFK